MHSATVMSARHSLGCDCLGAIRRGFRIAGSLLDAAGSSLRLGSRLLRLGGSSFSARSSLIRAIGRIDGALCRIWLARRATCRKRKG
jgi:hypothetical protein